ncbi:MAG: nuclear transport factor 2 family protein [Bacteroidota bacterium]|nr:nuclear transport factor 2 family protein [Bacteroidota bacterium]
MTGKFYFLIFISMIILGCNEQHSENIDESVTKRVLDNHWETFVNNDLEGLLEDYTEESIIVTQDGTHRGLEEIRKNYINAFSAFPKKGSTLKLTTSIVEKDIAYIIFEADTPDFILNYGSDTFIIRDGKIIRQTFAGVFTQK